MSSDVVFWQSVCGNSSPFWDYQSVWNTSEPTLPECFRKTALAWIPCATLWLLSPFEAYSIFHSRLKNIPWNVLNASKLVLCFCLFLVDAIGFIYHATFFAQSGDGTHHLDAFACLFGAFTMVLAGVFIFVGRRNGIISSGTQLCFWLTLGICRTINFAGFALELIDNEDVRMGEFEVSVEMIRFPMVVAQLLLTFLPDAEPLCVKESSKGSQNLNREEAASALSKLLYIWYDGLALLGHRRPLKMSDLGSLDHDTMSTTVIAKFNSKLNEVLRPPRAEDARLVKYDCVASTVLFSSKRANVQEKPFLVRTLFKVFGTRFLIVAALKLTGDLLAFGNPLVLHQLIHFVSGNEPFWHGFIYATLLSFLTAFETVLSANSMQAASMLALKIRTSLFSFVYLKALRLSTKARAKTTVGQIVNLMAVDVVRLIGCVEMSPFLVSAPFQLIIAMVELWMFLGSSCFVSVTVIFVLQGISIFIARQNKKLQVLLLKVKDQRIRIMNEVLNGIKVLKLFAWEVPFSDHVDEFRRKELKLLRRSIRLHSMNSTIWGAASLMISLCTFAAFVLISTDNVLDASKAFVSITVFNLLHRPMMHVPNLIATFVEGMVSVRRLNEFSWSDEIDPTAVEKVDSGDYAIRVENGEFSWGDSESPCLTNIAIDVKEGGLVAVVGPVGCGKSSLISAILGEMTKLSGTVIQMGSTALVPQIPWIQNATLRDNILFGKPYISAKYHHVLSACALLPDLEILTAGDMTEIGEKGINLSGGQKQRVSLARAVYCDASVYFLDDPLSAVDAQVGKHIFENIVGPKGLLKGKTRILVTHSLRYLSEVDLVIVLNNGTITEMGKYQELLNSGGAFSEYVSTYSSYCDTDEDEMSDIVKDGLKDSHFEIKRPFSATSEKSPAPQCRVAGSACRRKSPSVKADEEEPFLSKSMEGRLIKAETVETGKVKKKVYAAYLKSYGVAAIAVFVFMVLSHVSSAASTVWLSIWSSDLPNEDGSQNTSVRDLRLGVYAGIGFATVVFLFVSVLALIEGLVRASSFFHAKMLARVFRAPQWFFDTTPVGRTLNRFSGDMDVIDLQLPGHIRMFLFFIFQTLVALVIVIVKIPWLTLAAVPVIPLFYLLQSFSIASGRQIRRLASSSRSPIYSSFSESVSGASTIRAFRCEDMFFQDLLQKVDKNSTCMYLAGISHRWLIIRLEFLASVLVFAAALLAIWGNESFTPGTVGLIISYTIMLTVNLKTLFHIASLIETRVVSVERVMDYWELPEEAAWLIPEAALASSWPSEGSISFRDYRTKYRKELDTVLKGITCDIEAREKVGIVGRTGAGKSSFILSLFRIIEAVSGSIVIDDVDISKIGLHELRSRLTIIPQDPILFSGTLRLNLDPFNKHQDDDLWRMLEHAHLRSFISSLNDGLFHTIAEGGENLSVGQRQLICLARALLKKSKILILDEATATVDLETDELIQATIRREFNDCTVLTIAHRLNTVMDSDRIMVLDKGLIREFDTPSNLLKNKASLFYSMTKDAGLAP